MSNDITYPIPDAALDGRLAVVGISGSGKSTTAKGGVEKLLNAQRRVCVVDLLDGWWGLRLKRDGKTPAFPVIIFGGAHGDLPLTENAGKLIGRATRAEICKAAGWEPSSGHIKNVAGSLRTLAVVDYPAQGELELAEWVFQ